MKKIHLIAAAAALLLSGGVFMKVNEQGNMLLDANLEALTSCTEVFRIWWEGGEHGNYYKHRDSHATRYDQRHRIVQVMLVLDCEPGNLTCHQIPRCEEWLWYYDD